MTDGLRPTCLVRVMERAQSSSPGVTCMPFHPRCLESKQWTDEASVPLGGACAVYTAKAALCRGLLAAAAQGLQRGQDSACSLLSHGSWWVSGLPPCQPFTVALDRAVWGPCAECTSPPPVGPRAWVWPGVLGLLALKWREDGGCIFQNGHAFFSYSAFCSAKGESTGWPELSSPTLTPSPWSLTFFKSTRPTVVRSSLWSQIAEEQ